MARQPAPLVALVESASAMGGVEFSTLYLAEHCDPGQFRVAVICPVEGDLPQRCRALDIPVAIVAQPRQLSTSVRFGQVYLPNPAAWLFNGLGLFPTARRLARQLRNMGADLICTKGLYAHFAGGLAATWAGVPCVCHVQDLVSERAGKLYPAILGTAARWWARALIADGTGIADQLRPYYPNGQITLIHNGVDTHQFSPDVDGGTVRQEWGIGDDEILIGQVARLTPWKGQDLAIRAFAQVAREFGSLRLVLIGTPLFDTGAYERELRQLVRDLQLDGLVLFAGFRWDLPAVLAALDVYLHPSLSKDTSPLALVSAMASGKAIVASNVPGIAEVMGAANTAILVAPGHVASLAAGLRQILADPQMRAALGRHARRQAENELAVEVFARRCEAVFQRALAA